MLWPTQTKSKLNYNIR